MMKKFFEWLESFSSPSQKSSQDFQTSKLEHGIFDRKASQHVPDSQFLNEKTAFSETAPDYAQDIKNVLLDSHLESAQDIELKNRLDEALKIANSHSSLIQDHQKSSAIAALIGEEESALLLRLLRWREGIQCPYCHSKHVKMISQKPQKFRCLDCQSAGSDSEFDALTSYFPKSGDWHSARTWVLINYLKMFMPISKVAKVLGLSLEELLRILAMSQGQQSSLKKDLKAKTKN